MYHAKGTLEYLYSLVTMKLCSDLVLRAWIGMFAECVGDLFFVQIACPAGFVSRNKKSIVSFCCCTKNFASGTVAEI